MLINHAMQSPTYTHIYLYKTNIHICYNSKFLFVCMPSKAIILLIGDDNKPYRCSHTLCIWTSQSLEVYSYQLSEAI